MAFLRIKNIKSKNGSLHPYFYIVKNVWTSKGARQKVIGYLGRVDYLQSIPKEMMLELWSKYDNKCAICKKEEWLTLDHITPLSKGGSNNIDNLQVLCKECNLKKRDLLEKPLEISQQT